MLPIPVDLSRTHGPTVPDVILFVVAAGRARPILESICDTAHFDSVSGTGIAFQLDIENAVGLNTKLPAILGHSDEHT
ncbi:MAG: hypothetical protein OXL68_21680 [Paracoccaceae bacterium]|nr:hypothetical protein [Paracoccaceae bacterium]